MFSETQEDWELLLSLTQHKGKKKKKKPSFLPWDIALNTVWPRFKIKCFICHLWHLLHQFTTQISMRVYFFCWAVQLLPVCVKVKHPLEMRWGDLSAGKSRRRYCKCTLYYSSMCQYASSKTQCNNPKPSPIVRDTLITEGISFRLLYCGDWVQWKCCTCSWS